jgi:HAD superfamily hydrolase (TIGR01490 family)
MEGAFFDLDKTVIARSSVLAFGRPLYRGGLLSRPALVRSLCGQAVYRLQGAGEAKMARARRSMLSITRGWERARVTGVVGETFDEVVPPLVFAEALELFEEHRGAGRRIFLVSSSPVEIVAPLAEYLGADEYIASRPGVDEAGLFTGELEFYAYGPHKAAAVIDAARRDGIDLAGSYAYSDSITDVPMLEAVGHAVAVNPDRKLARLARRRDWEVRRFERPVPFRSRVGGVLAAVGFCIAGYRWLRSRQPEGGAWWPALPNRA